MIYYDLMDEQLKRCGITIHQAQTEFMNRDYEAISKYYKKQIIPTEVYLLLTGQIIVKHRP